EPGESILVFSRPTPYRSGDVVTAILDKAPDIHGCQIDSALSIRFTVDAEGPRVRGFFPEDTIITNPQTMIKINLEDDISGVRLSSINLTLNDLVYPFDNRILTYGYDTTVYGYCLNLNPLELFGPSGFPDGTYRLCLNDVTDSIDLGEPNHLVGAPWCWRFIVNSHGPIANLISPPNGVITSCAEQPIRFTISDGNGLNLSTLRIVVNGRNYDITSLRAINDTTYEFAQPWTNGLTVNFNLTTCEDSLRTPIHNPISCNFTVDLSPPVVLNPTPTPNDTVGEPFPVVSANVADSIAGLRFSSLRFVVGRDTISYGNPAITFVPPSTFRLNLESIGYPRPVGFDTVRVCILAEDTAQICSPNATTFCWSFFRNLTGPIGYPLIDSLLCTMHSQLRFFLHNSEGVLFSSVVLRIEYPADTVIYRGTVDSELSYTVDTLIFTPSRGWLDGARYRACITEAEDLYGTPISSPICASFRVDISPPYVVAYSPSTIDINDTLQPITIVLGDTARSIEPLSIKFIILRDTLRITSPGLILRNDTLRFDPALAGISYPQRETLAVLLEVSDRCGHTLHWQHQWYETKVDEQSNIIPTELSILRVHPNPFNASVNITIGVPSETNIVIEILDIMGRRVKPLYNGLIKPPFATFIWDGTEKNGNKVSSGIYFLRISDGKIIKHKSIIFLK
ncbi:MAG: T9SS type A sorting domain-containing protein, partial [bacterium]